MEHEVESILLPLFMAMWYRHGFQQPIYDRRLQIRLSL